MTELAGNEEIVEEKPVDDQQGGEQQGGEQPGGVDKTLAGGGGGVPEEEPKGYWPEDWRERMAEDRAAGDEKAKAQILKQLERYQDPTSIFGKARELEGIFSSGNLIKRPGEDATEEEVAQYRKAMGVPENTDDYVAAIKLPDNQVLGDDEKPFADEFAKVMHEANATPDQYNKAVNWYFDLQRRQAEQLDEFDDQNRTNGERTLKEEWGGSFKRTFNSMPSVFQYAPGGMDGNNAKSLYSRLLTGRMSDGVIIGDDPDMSRWLARLAAEVDPVGTVMGEGNMSGQSLDAEIKEIEDMMRGPDRKKYFADEAKQARYRELLAARSRNQAKA